MSEVDVPAYLNRVGLPGAPAPTEASTWPIWVIETRRECGRGGARCVNPLRGEPLIARLDAAAQQRVRGNGVWDMRCRSGERVVARREFQGMNRPTVPSGAEGEVVTTTVLGGRPKTVRFRLMTAWGPKTFTTAVDAGDVGQPG